MVRMMMIMMDNDDDRNEAHQIVNHLTTAGNKRATALIISYANTLDSIYYYYMYCAICCTINLTQFIHENCLSESAPTGCW